MGLRPAPSQAPTAAAKPPPPPPPCGSASRRPESVTPPQKPGIYIYIYGLFVKKWQAEMMRKSLPKASTSTNLDHDKIMAGLNEKGIPCSLALDCLPVQNQTHRARRKIDSRAREKDRGARPAPGTAPRGAAVCARRSPGLERR